MEVQQQHPKLFNNVRYVGVPGADLYQGDCLAAIPQLAGGFDAVVTDPPYSSGGQSKGSRAASTGAKYLNNCSSDLPDFAGDSKDQRSYLHWSALWMALCYDKLNPGGLMIVFSDWRQLPVTSDALQAAGFTWRGTGVWDKAGSARPYRGGFRAQTEFFLWGSKGPLAGVTYSPGLFRVQQKPSEKLHQVGKPLALMDSLVAACGPSILDPFMGSATTGMAALQAGKKFTGIELSARYFDVSVERLRNR
ncbi:MAG: adenine methyltransferase [Candidatus Dactylopiibacterium carminicum]|uniref:Methyltransferase n=1 Tax=Candidatus Dactylopiibacterium carminicum TaxID=857335 RepID=A0A272EYD7_9RHOO|nr:DNA methyltransferase [Candidatus Dactylopiibacterium carminicum]KAF7600634.1 site-specific DNA-methyltransferase [Candidatus Dactylopiibacterium carminicum]PAS95132.1 MAG: adenine methyltransferase [Candidatus Dactylopiibacterium carminicum]